MSQLSFATLDHRNKKKQTKRERFLAEMESVVPWRALVGLIEPHYPKAGNGRRPYPLAVMLRIYFLQQCYQLSDPGAEEGLYDIQSMRAFAGLELGRDAIPDETTILNFRHLLEANDLTKAIFEAVSKHLEDKGALLRGGTIMDATLIAASPSTKNKSGKRDPEMSQSKKGNQWYFGMKAHIGVDARSGLVHTAGVTTGKVHDAKVMDNLIREDDRSVFADKGYVNEKKKITYGFFRTFGNELAAPNRGQVVVGIPQPSTEPETTMSEDKQIPEADNGPSSGLSNVIKIDDERIKGHLDRVVRGTVEDTLNALLDAEAVSC